MGKSTISRRLRRALGRLDDAHVRERACVKLRLCQELGVGARLSASEVSALADLAEVDAFVESAERTLLPEEEARIVVDGNGNELLLTAPGDQA